MDPVSLAASIIAFVQVADRIIEVCKHCIETIEDAPKDMCMILGETTSLKAIMDSLAAPGIHANTMRLVPGLFDRIGPIEACRRCLSALENLLPSSSMGPPGSQNKRRRITFAELAWPLKESKARKLLAEISHHKATMLLAITGDMIHEIKDIRTGVQRLEYAMTDTQRLEIVRWIECTNPSPLHNAAFLKHEKKTSAWLLASSEWQNWVMEAASSRLMWIHGIPGVGKTVLASFIIEQLKQLRENDSKVGTAYYYCHYSHAQNEAAPFLRWTIGQLCRQAGWVPESVKRLHDQGCDPSIPELENALEAVLSKFRVAYVVIDAVDESSPREDLVTVIATLSIDKRFRSLQILATSREYFDIERILSRISISISMANPQVERDLRAFVRARLTSSRLLRRWNHLFCDIENALVTGAHGMFRWADCQIYSIERLHHESHIIAALNNLPKDLAETYVRIIDAIPEANRPFVRRVLLWVGGHTGAQWLVDRGINVDLLLSSVAFDLGEVTTAGKPYPYDINHLKEFCSCLITITPGSQYLDDDDCTSLLAPTATEFQAGQTPETDINQTIEHEDLSYENDSFVSLAHYTVMEFLTSPLIDQTSVSFFALSDDAIDSEFTRSVLRQALQADPTGTSADWIYDRESYCLTLVPALILPDPEAEQLFFEYLNPERPHFRRIYSIQKRILASANIERGYILTFLPFSTTLVHDYDDFATSGTQAKILLNLLAFEFDASLTRKFFATRNTKHILNIKLSATWLVVDFDPLNKTLQVVPRTFIGTIPEIIRRKLESHPDDNLRRRMKTGLRRVEVLISDGSRPTPT